MNFFKRKIVDLRHKYGDEEANYFKDNPVCETCGEERLVCLTVHHIHGVKNSSKVKTLCFNCHMIVHAPKSGNFTYKDHIELENSKKLHRNSLDEKYILSYEKTGSLRAAALALGVSHNAIRNTLIKNKIDYDKSRSGHKSKNAG